jgi:ribulose 1,5-bisphosphate synthetase/thiazole synthase
MQSTRRTDEENLLNHHTRAFRVSRLMARYDVVVIGAGLGGLTAGATLARESRDFSWY